MSFSSLLPIGAAILTGPLTPLTYLGWQVAGFALDTIISRRKKQSSLDGPLENLIGSRVPLPEIYGRNLVAGPIFHQAQSGDDLSLGIAWSEGEIQAINDLRLNDVGEATLGADLSFVNHLGTLAQSADSGLNGTALEDCALKRTAYTLLTADTSNRHLKNKRLVATALIAGKLVDVYDGSWNTEYSRNPAWIVRDFLINVAGFPSTSIDEDSFYSVAQYCDAELSGGDAGLLGHYFDELINREDGDYDPKTDSFVGTRQDATVDFEEGASGPSPRDWDIGTGAGQIALTDYGGGTSDDFGARWQGKLNVPSAQTDWTFYVSVDDGVRLYIDDVLVIDAWSEGDREVDSTALFPSGVTLGQGKHDIRLEYFQGPGDSECILKWSSTGAGISKQVISSSYLSYEPGKRFVLDYVVDEERSWVDHLDGMLKSFGGYLIRSGDGLKLGVYRNETPSITQAFTEDNIAQGSFSGRQARASEAYNRVTVHYRDPDFGWNVLDVQANDDRAQTDEGLVKDLSLDLPGITRRHQAARVARMLLRRSRDVTLFVEFTTTIAALHVEPGDYITVKHSLLNNASGTAITFQVTVTEELPDDNVRIAAEKYVGHVYGDETDAGENFQKYVPTVPTVDPTVPDADELDIEDAGGYYAGGDVEAALQEIGAALAMIGQREEFTESSGGTTQYDCSVVDYDSLAIYEIWLNGQQIDDGQYTLSNNSGKVRITFGADPYGGVGDTVILIRCTGRPTS